KLKMKKGDKFKIYSFNYKGIDLEFEIAGELPGTRWTTAGIMNASYFNHALDTWSSNPNNKNKEAAHPLSQRRLNIVWLRVRERRTEMAVLKVLGFRPLQIQVLVLGEAILVGALSGLVASGATLAIINGVYGGLPFQIGFFPAFKVPLWALAWGLAIGGGTG